MTEMREFTEFADGPMVFPYQGKKYTAPPIPIEVGLRLNGIINNGEDTDQSVVELWKLALGELWDEFVADAVPLTFVNRVGSTVLADFEYGRVYAEAFWETGGDPKAVTEYMKGLGNRASRRSKSTAGATKTPSRASTRATTSRKS